MRIQRLLALLVSAVVTAGLLGVSYPAPMAAAGCVGPTLAVGDTATPGPTSGSPSILVRGQTATIAGISFHAGCEDTFVSAGPGCQASQPTDPQSPLTDVQLVLTQGDRSWELGAADAADRDRQYAISWTVSIPTDVAVGPATLTAAAASIPVQIRD